MYIYRKKKEGKNVISYHIFDITHHTRVKEKRRKGKQKQNCDPRSYAQKKAMI